MPAIQAPTHPLLQQLAAADWPADPSRAADAVSQLIGFMVDPDVANRDWAVFLLAQSPADGPEVRDALVRAAADSSLLVRGEAVLGLARRDRALALPHVQAALTLDAVSAALFEAAGLCAHPALIPDLEEWARPSANRLADMAATEALMACRAASGQPGAARQRHRHIKLRLELLEDMGHACLPARAQPPYPWPIHHDGAGPQADMAQDIEAGTHAPIGQHGDRAA
jgi:hypothetical protein